MKPGIVRLIEDARKNPRDQKVRRNWYIFSMCILIALFIWLMVKLSAESYTDIRYPLEFTQIPVGNILVSKSDSTVHLSVRSDGFDLLAMKYLSRKEPIYLSLRSGGSYILTQPYKNQIARQLELDDRLFQISPDTIFIQLEPILDKKVAVIPKIDFTFKEPYKQYGAMLIEPDSIMVSGPLSVIDTIHYIPTQQLSLQNVQESAEGKVAIRKPLGIRHFAVHTDSISYLIPSEKFTESTLLVPVLFDGDELNIKTFPEDVEITYQVALKDFDKVTQEQFRVIVAFGDESIESMLKVEVVEFPGYIHISSIRPQHVEYIILK